MSTTLEELEKFERQMLDFLRSHNGDKKTVISITAADLAALITLARDGLVRKRNKETKNLPGVVDTEILELLPSVGEQKRLSLFLE